MPVIVGLGRTLLQFGLVMFAASVLVVAVFYAYGMPVPSALAYAAQLFPIVGLTSGVLGVLGTVGRAFVPQIAQWAGYAYYLGLFLPAITGITTLVGQLVSLIPMPGFIGGGVVAAATSISGFSMYYYIVSRVSGVPAE